MKIKLLYHKVLIGHMSSEEVSMDMYKYYYDYTCDEMRKTLDKITLADIMK